MWDVKLARDDSCNAGESDSAAQIKHQIQFSGISHRSQTGQHSFAPLDGGFEGLTSFTGVGSAVP